MKNPTPIFYPKLSRYLFFYLLFSHCFALLCLVVTLQGVLLFLSLFLLCLSGCYYYLYYRGKLSFKRIQSFQCLSVEQWKLVMTDGTVYMVTLSGDSVVMRYFMLLRFVNENVKKNDIVLLFPDSLLKEQLKIIRRCARVGVM